VKNVTVYDRGEDRIIFGRAANCKSFECGDVPRPVLKN
jgi:hypothetical protein